MVLGGDDAGARLRVVAAEQGVELRQQPDAVGYPGRRGARAGRGRSGRRARSRSRGRRRAGPATRRRRGARPRPTRRGPVGSTGRGWRGVAARARRWSLRGRPSADVPVADHRGRRAVAGRALGLPAALRAVGGPGHRDRSRSSGRPGCRGSLPRPGRAAASHAPRWVLSSAGVRHSSRAKSSMPAQTSSSVVRSSLRVRCHRARWPSRVATSRSGVVLGSRGVHGAADVAAPDDPVGVVRREMVSSVTPGIRAARARNGDAGRLGLDRSDQVQRPGHGIDIAPRHVGELTCQGATRQVLPRVHGRDSMAEV